MKSSNRLFRDSHTQANASFNGNVGSDSQGVSMKGDEDVQFYVDFTSCQEYGEERMSGSGIERHSDRCSQDSKGEDAATDTSVSRSDDNSSSKALSQKELRRNMFLLREQWSQASLQSYARKSAISLMTTSEDGSLTVNTAKNDPREGSKLQQQKRKQQRNPLLNGGHNATFDLSSKTSTTNENSSRSSVRLARKFLEQYNSKSIRGYFSSNSPSQVSLSSDDNCNSELSSLSSCVSTWQQKSMELVRHRPSTGFKEVAIMRPSWPVFQKSQNETAETSASTPQNASTNEYN